MFHGYSGSSNGHYSVGQQREGRPRRGRGGTGGGVRASHHSQQFQERNPVPPCTEYDKAYFHAYSDIGIHEEMIKDHVRTSTYRAAIMRYQDSIAGKVVMDVGCGTGILAIFCALAGARRVLLKPSTTRSDCDFFFLMCCGSHLCLFLQVPGVTFPQHAAGSIEGFFQLVLVACSSLPCRKVFQELGKVLNDET